MNYRYQLDDLIRKADVSSSEALVLHTLASYINETNKQCNPSLELLCQGSKMSKPGVIRILERLSTNSFIFVEKGVGRGNPNDYTLFPNHEIGRGASISEEINSNPELPINEINGNPQIVTLGENSNPELPINGEMVTLSESPSNEQLHTDKQTPARETSFDDPLFVAICEICDVDPGCFSSYYETEIPKVADWLLTQFTDAEIAAKTAADQFAHWDKKGPPVPKQIRSDWKRMGRLAKQYAEDQNPKPTQNQNGTHQPIPQRSHGHAARSGTNPTQQRVQSRQQLAAKLAEKYGGRGSN